MHGKILKQKYVVEKYGLCTFVYMYVLYFVGTCGKIRVATATTFTEVAGIFAALIDFDSIRTSFQKNWRTAREGSLMVVLFGSWNMSF